MKRRQGGSTPKQWAYANRKLNGQGRTKKEMAILSGFSPAVSENVKHKIESTEGYRNALIGLAQESGDVLLALIQEYKNRGIDELSNSELNSAVNAITGAWDRIESRRNPIKSKDPEQNPLRRAILQKVENQTINMAPTNTPPSIPQLLREAQIKNDEDDF